MADLLEFCRGCGSTQLEDVLDLGEMYPSGFIKEDVALEKIPYTLIKCKYCGLVQLKYTNDLDSMYKEQYWYKSALNNSMLRDLKDVVENIEKIVELKDGDMVVDIGCFPAGELVTLADYTQKPIENIEKGDAIISGENNKRIVTDVFTRIYRGKLYTITSFYGYKLTATEEHPILKYSNGSLVYTPIKELDIKDFIAIPRKNSNSSFVKLTDDETYLFGWYLAEGSVIYSHKPKICGLNFTLSIDETAYAEHIRESANRLGLNSAITIRKEKSTIDVRVYGKQFAERVVTLFGKGCKNKFIGSEVFCWYSEDKLNLLRNLFLGDGHFRKQSGGGYSYALTTKSASLAAGVKTLLEQFGVASSTYYYVKKSFYSLTISGEGTSLLTNMPIENTREPYKILDDYILVPINKITLTDSILQVYNFEVETDHSYIINGIAVHNCNDGSLLTFYTNQDLNKIGFDPAPNLKEIAETRCSFINDYFPVDKEFGEKAKVVTSIAMFYDLPNPNKFIKAVKNILDTDGIWVIQYTDLVNMLKFNEFTNICLEHLEYYDLNTINKLLTKHNLTIFKVEYNKTNGASTRLYVCHKNARPIEDSFYNILAEELDYLNSEEGSFRSFKLRIDREIAKFKSFLWKAKSEYKLVVGLGASTKANTFLQYADISTDLIPIIGEVNPDKFGLRTLGSNLKIVSEEEMFDQKPDYIVIFIWQFTENILNKPKIKSFIEQGGKVVVYLPEFKIYEKESDISKKTPAMLIDELTTTLIKCFMAQERVMNPKNNEDLIIAAKAAQELNAKRNKLIRAIDKELGFLDASPTEKTYG